MVAAQTLAMHMQAALSMHMHLPAALAALVQCRWPHLAMRMQPPHRSRSWTRWGAARTVAGKQGQGR